MFKFSLRRTIKNGGKDAQVQLFRADGFWKEVGKDIVFFKGLAAGTLTML